MLHPLTVAPWGHRPGTELHSEDPEGNRVVYQWRQGTQLNFLWYARGHIHIYPDEQLPGDRTWTLIYKRESLNCQDCGKVHFHSASNRRCVFAPPRTHP